MDQNTQISIQTAKQNWDIFLKQNNSTSNKDVWRVYDHLTADLYKECLDEVLGSIDKELDTFCEKVIVDEFQIN